MKTIGLLGGTAWISTIEYYRLLNEKMNQRLGKNHSAKVILYSIDYEEIKKYNYQNWEVIQDILQQEILRLDACAVDCIMICNNTLHKAYEVIAQQMDISTPVFHIADCAAEYAKSKNINSILLLGTKFTMEDGFYQKRLESVGLQVTIPDESERNNIQRITQEELSKGIFLKQSKKWFQEMIQQYDCDAVMLACTELPLLIQQDDFDLPIINTIETHCEFAVNFAMSS